ncbi:MAG TPA: ComEC/Rec2 family competence protein [Microbacterium sp.]|uniref:ComEC/Rec2 family competence protein n=1 Tax=Microbacterium sp. TaxID=51671 RepID=UPI002BD1036D|nr:ComEC/Rec2 family competence protein [Microbacterium sp.]HWI30399.1 ComEC/Rec2 family competence protein [Microbacterium sp.]
MRARDLRLVPIAAATWAASLAAILLPEAAAWVCVALWTLALAALGWAAARRSAGVVAVIALSLALAAVAASHVALAQPARQQVLSVSLTGGRAVDVTAVVTTKVERGPEGRLRFEARATLIDVGGARTPVDVPISVTLAAGEVEGGVLDLGSEIVARGTAAGADAGEAAVIVVFASRGVEVIAEPAGILEVTSALRGDFVRTASVLPQPGAGLLPGLAVGETRAVDAELDAAMKASSLTHLTAVSGANCAIVVGFAFAAAAACGASRGVRVIAALLALGGFVALVTPEPSVLRAAAMASIGMLAVLLGRTGAGLAVLCAAVTALLVGDPWLAASLGFSLSVAATAALLMLAPPLARGLARGMPRPLALALSVPLAAQLACGPLIVLVSPTVPLYGVLANLVAGPAAPLATIIGLLACLAAPLPWVADALAALAWVPSAWIAATAHTVAGLPEAVLPWIEGWPGVATLAAVGGAVALVIARAGRTARVDAALRGVAGTCLAVTVGVVCGGVALGGLAGPLTVPGDWSIAACDVGQGDAVLLRSEGRIALVDTGPEPAPLAACLSRVGISRIDLLVLTHFDLDHVGGLDAVLGRVDVVVHGPPASHDDQALVDALVAAGARAVEGHVGLTGRLGAASWRVVWPRAGGHAFPAGNDASVVLDIGGGGIPRALLLGDLSAAAQRAVHASDELAARYTVVKIAHHGSADQDPALYAALAPAVALVTVGADNDYGHPRKEILDVLQELDAVIARTDEEGLIALTRSGTGVDVWRERAPR